MTIDWDRYEKANEATIEVVYRESQTVLARQDARIAQVETKASWLLSTSGALLALIAAFVPVWLDRQDPAGATVVLGVIALAGFLGAAVLALVALQGKRYPATDYGWLLNLTDAEVLARGSAPVQASLAADAFDKARTTSVNAAGKARAYRWSLRLLLFGLAGLSVLAAGAIVDYVRT